MLEKLIKYGFGRTDISSRIHIIALVPSWETGALCGAYIKECYINERLRLQNVDCEECKDSLTYHRLLIKVKRNTSSAEHSAEIISSQDLPKDRTYKELRMILNNDGEISCHFLTMVVKMESIINKYEGGVKAFVEHYHVRLKRDIAVICTMGFDGLDDPYMDLDNNGLKPEEDYVILDVGRKVLAYTMLKDTDYPHEKSPSMPVKWLKGRFHKSCIMVHYVS